MAKYRPMMLLADLECHGKQEWVDENKRSAARKAMGRSIARSWPGVHDEAEWAGAND